MTSEVDAETFMPRRILVQATALCLVLGAVAGCTSSGQQLAQMETALSVRSQIYGPVMYNDAEPIGTHEPTLALIPANSPQEITLLSASLIPLPGFRTPRLLSVGVIAGGCSAGIGAFPSANGRSIVVYVNQHRYQPLALHGYRMLIGGTCIEQMVYVVQATQAGQYATGGLRVKVSYQGHLRIMFAYDGIDVWFYGSGPVPTAADVVNGLNAAFGAQMKLFHRRN
jgi:hypothetical protein